MRKGFTLVELSIVLVIIGFLVGGILIGQSLISTAQLQSVVRTMQQYNIAAEQFLTKFRKLPGDSTYFTPASNANGSIDGAAGCTGLYRNAEAYYFYSHLSQAQMVKKTFATYQPTDCGGTNDTNHWNTNSAKQQNTFPVVKIGNTESNVLVSSAATLYAQFYPGRLDAVAFDNKIDDGNMGSGLVRGVWGVWSSYGEYNCDKIIPANLTQPPEPQTCHTRFIFDARKQGLTQCQFFNPGTPEGTGACANYTN